MIVNLKIEMNVACHMKLVNYKMVAKYFSWDYFSGKIRKKV